MKENPKGSRLGTAAGFLNLELAERDEMLRWVVERVAATWAKQQRAKWEGVEATFTRRGPQPPSRPNNFPTPAFLPHPYFDLHHGSTNMSAHSVTRLGIPHSKFIKVHCTP